MATRRLDKVYSDIRADMATHPVSDDLLLHNNEAAIETSIKNLLLTADCRIISPLLIKQKKHNFSESSFV